jgi:helix-turn-helix protein
MNRTPHPGIPHRPWRAGAPEHAHTGDRGPASCATVAGAGGLTGDATMSVEAISWALNLAPVPTGRGGQPSSACKFVLVGLANHAGPDGTGAFPSVATLVRYTGLAERTVRTCLDRLAAEGIVAPCDPAVVAARIKRADRRPQGWDLNLGLVRGDLDAAAAALEHRLPGAGRRARCGYPARS